MSLSRESCIGVGSFLGVKPGENEDIFVLFRWKKTVMTEYFRSRQNFQFEKSFFEWWLKSKKKKQKVIGEHMLILDWQNSKYFVGQLGELKISQDRRN